MFEFLPDASVSVELSRFRLATSRRSNEVRMNIFFLRMTIHLLRVNLYLVNTSLSKMINLTGLYKSCFVFNKKRGLAQTRGEASYLFAGDEQVHRFRSMRFDFDPSHYFLS